MWTAVFTPAVGNACQDGTERIYRRWNNVKNQNGDDQTEALERDQ